MNNINTIDKNNNPKPNSRKNLGYIFMIAGLLNANSPIYAKTSNYNNTSTEQVIPNANKLNGIKLPTVYQNKLDNFLANNTVMKDNDAKNYTLNFVEKEMESDRGISKENQLLFIRHAIYKQVTDQDLYDGQDGSQKLAEDFSNKAVNIRIRACGQKYRNEIITYMNKLSADAQQRSADAQQRSADAQQRSADAQQRSAEAINIGLKQITEYYDLCKSNPTAINNEELEETKKYAKHVIQNCKKYGINYRAILLKEVGGDAKKVDEILKFYGVDTPTQSAHNLENNISNTLGIANDIQKIYNLCVNGSIITPEQKDYIQQRMEELKENGIDCVDILKGLAKKEGTNIDPVLDNLVA